MYMCVCVYVLVWARMHMVRVCMIPSLIKAMNILYHQPADHPINQITDLHSHI